MITALMGAAGAKNGLTRRPTPVFGTAAVPLESAPIRLPWIAQSTRP